MAHAWLIVKEGGERGSRFELKAGETLIGRHPRSDLRLLDPSASREHAMIGCDGEGFTLEDLQSTNGTHVNGKRVRTAVLQQGDLIRIGAVIFEFRLGE